MVSQKKMLLCSPTHFRVSYSINPWMQGGVVDVDRAEGQWVYLRNQLRRLGADIQVIEPHPCWPDMVFTANGGLVHENKVILSNFRYPQRRGEKELFRKWFEEAGYEVYELPVDVYFEGRGEALVCGDTLIGGYGWRTDKRALELIAEILGLKLMTLKLVDEKYYHLDTCFALIDKEKGLAVYNPSAFSWWSRLRMRLSQWLGGTVLRLISVGKEEAARFACNCVVVDNNVLIPTGNYTTSDKLKKLGYNVIEIPMTEFMKSGGACKCLVLELN